MAARLAVTVRTDGLSRGDRRALAVLLAIPVVVFVVPALFGHPIVNADNEIQNLPLRALAGADLRHGRLSETVPPHGVLCRVERSVGLPATNEGGA